MMETKRLSLPQILATRDSQFDKDGLLTNCYHEQTPIGDMIVKRPGYTVSQTLASGCAQGAFTLNGTPYFIVADSFGSSQSGIGGATWTAQNSPAKPTTGVSVGTMMSLGGNLYVVGAIDSGNTSSSVYRSVDNGTNWTTIATPFTSGTVSAPLAQSGVAFGSKLYIVGAYNSAGNARQVLSSPDGITWTSLTTNLSGGALTFTGLITHNSLLYAFFNLNPGIQCWSSPDGITWTSVGSSTVVTVAAGYRICSLNGVLYVIGGRDGSGTVGSTVFKSIDNGVTWVSVTTTGAFGPLQNMACWVFQSALWVAGGTLNNAGGAVNNAVWRSTDGGVTWAQVTANAGWTARQSPCFTLHNSTMYVGIGVNAAASGPAGAVAFAATTTTTAFSPAPSTTCQPYQTYDVPATLSTTAKTVLKNTTNAYVWDGSVLTAVTSGNYPPLTVPGVAVLDGTTYVMTPTGQIYGSAINDPTSWSALNFISANQEADPAVALCRQLNYIIAFKQYSTEVFYDAGNPTGSPLSKVLNALLEIGCAAAGSIAYSDNTIFFMAASRQKGRSIMKMEGYTPRYVSNPFVDRLLNADSLSAVYAFVVKTNGHFFYVLTLVNTGITLVLDEMTGEWHKWTSMAADAPLTVTTAVVQTDGSILVTMPLPHAQADGNAVTIAGASPSAANGQFNLRYNTTVHSTRQFSYVPASTVTGAITGSITATFFTESYFPGLYYTSANGQDLLLDKTSGKVYTFSPSTYADNGNPIDVKIRTMLYDFGVMFSKRFNRFELVGDKVDTDVLVRYSDDDYTSWSLYRTINMNTKRAKISNLGSGRRRAFELRNTEQTELRLLAAETDFDVGAF